jgi:PPOX class probable FMN-dependent enzyme
MSEWVDELTRALSDEFGDKPHVCTLATVDKNGAPRARSIVCRKLASDGSLWIVSDARSEKNEHLKAAPQAEAVFWLPTSRQQFRLLGSVRISNTANDPARQETWQGLSDGARALFFWPSPGAKRIDPPGAFPEAMPASTAVPPSFELLILRPKRVDHLQLAQHPHRRRRWMLAGNWSAAAEVNP